MTVLGIILARAGSKGLPDKCLRRLHGRPVIAYTFDHARSAHSLSALVLSTDSAPAKRLARQAGIEVIDRPSELADDKATVDAAARHAVETWERRHESRIDAVVLMYGNIPMRAPGLIDRAVEKLRQSGPSSVRSIAPVAKQHPDWVHRLDGDRMIQFRPNSIYRRQDLEPIFYHDGAAVVVTRDALFGALDTPHDHQSFLGSDRRAVVQSCDQAIDIDEPIDLAVAHAILATRTASAPPLSIGSRQIGHGQRTLVIAEAGVNHNGSVDTALRMVDVAHAAAADAIKFQIFDAAALAVSDAPTALYQDASGRPRSQRDMLSSLQISIDDLRRIRKHCDARSIIMLATPFGVREMQQVVTLGLPAVKIASTDLTTTPLLEAAVQTGLPLIVSTGAATIDEIDAAVDLLDARGARDRLMLLHCVSAYPTSLDVANLGAINTLRHTYALPVGFSDHTVSTRTGALAVAAGACVLEKHFTLDPAASGPDHAMSLGPEQLGEYVIRVREAEAALGSGILGMNPIESDVRTVARKSVVSATTIRAGEIITAEKLTLKRPGTGLSANELDRLIGRRAVVDIPCDSLLDWNMTGP